MIFVFGSNVAGRHGAGAALAARKYYGAIPGVGNGPQGNAYAIPTKGSQLQTLSINAITVFVDEFLDYAERYPETGFQITCIGCGLAGYTHEEIAPLFKEAPKTNCFFDLRWRPILGTEFEYWGSL